jgi:hypothetical protein
MKLAVSGMICMMPRAPLGEISLASKSDSVRATA